MWVRGEQVDRGGAADVRWSEVVLGEQPGVALLGAYLFGSL